MPKPVSLVIPSKLPPDKCATEKHPDDPRVQVYDISSGSFAINASQLVDHEAIVRKAAVAIRGAQKFILDGKSYHLHPWRLSHAVL